VWENGEVKAAKRNVFVRTEGSNKKKLVRAVKTIYRCGRASGST